MSHIRIISPSGAIDPSYIDGAVARLRQWGFEVSEGRHARSKSGRFAGEDWQRLKDIKEAIDDSTVDYVLCSRGGYGLQRIIEPLNHDCSDKHLPAIIGFSDITILHQFAAARAVPSVHGLMCKHLATLPEDSDPIRYWKAVLQGEPIHYTIPSHPLNRMGEVSGIVRGGNLSVLYGLQGTPWGLDAQLKQIFGEYSLDDTILFIEDIGERHYHIERMMLNLKMSGVLEHIKGLIVGQFSDCEDDVSMGETIYETIRRLTDEYAFPMVFNFPAGHVEYNLPLWLGKRACLRVGEQTELIYEE